jgi:hypothetical protein
LGCVCDARGPGAPIFRFGQPDRAPAERMTIDYLKP